jgi:predicted RND superfamily exporter protein
MIIRLHAMYQGSRKILAFLITILVSLTITTGVLLAIAESYAQWGKLRSFMTYGLHNSREEL